MVSLLLNICPNMIGEQEVSYSAPGVESGRSDASKSHGFRLGIHRWKYYELPKSICYRVGCAEQAGLHGDHVIAGTADEVMQSG